MAATELSGHPSRRTRQRDAAVTAGAWLHAYAAIWGTTLTSAGIVALAGRALILPTRRILGLSLASDRNPPPHLAQILELAGHNIPVAAWPLLLGLTGADRHRVRRRATGAVVLAAALANTVPVGAALGAYGAPLIVYVPQLPLEWCALALGYGSWITQLHTPLATHGRVARLALIILTLLCAATIETLAVPHR